MVTLDFSSTSVEIIVAIIGLVGVVAAALITGAITLIVQSRQLKRDGKTIGETKDTVSDMHPKIDTIHRRTEKQADKMEILVADVEHRKRLEASLPQSASARDMIHAGTQAILEQNSNLVLQYRQLELQYQKAQDTILALNAENTRLHSEINRLMLELRTGQQKNRPVQEAPDQSSGFVPKL